MVGKFRPIFFLAILLLLTACGGEILGTNNNWPGLGTDGDTVYMAIGSRIIAVDATNESEVWRFPAENSPAPLLAPPTIDGDRVYAVDYGVSQGFFSPGVLAGVYALDDSDLSGGVPAQVWHNDRVARDRIVAAPLAVNGSIYVGTADNAVIALDANDGEVIWEETLEHSVWGQPAYADGRLIVTSLDKTVRAFDAESGQQLWLQEVGGAIPSRPLVIEDRIYVTGFDAQLHAYDLDGNPLWQADSADWIWNAPAYADGRLFYGDVKGNVYAVDADSGEQLWQIEVTGSVEAGLALADDGTLFIASVIGVSTDEQSGELLAVSADSGDQLWRKELSTPIFTTPTIAADRLVVLFTNTAENPFELRFYDLATGNEAGVFVPSE